MKKIILFLLTASMLFSQVSVFAEETETSNTDIAETTDVIETEVEKPVVGEGKAIFVDMNATAGGDGSFEKPFKDIAAAKAAAANSDKSEKVTVYIREGEYELINGLKFNSSDSGTKENPVTFCAYNGEKVVISGAKILKKNLAKKMSADATIYSKVPNASRDYIWEIDLKKAGIKNFGELPGGDEEYGAMGDTYSSTNYSELIYDDTVMTMARYPNNDYITITNILSESGSGLEMIKTAQVSKDEVDVNRWKGLSDIRISIHEANWGYLSGKSRIIGVDVAKNAIITQGNNGGTMRVKSRFFVYNLPEELDVPCEYYLDRDNSKLYFYSPDENLTKTMKLTILEEPFLTFEGAEYIKIKGISFENSRGDGVHLSGGTGVVIEDCRFTNLCGMGIRGYRTRNCHILSNEISNCGHHGICMTGDASDIKSLETSGNIIEGNDIFNIGRIRQATCEGIRIHYNNGIKVINNRIHDMPHEAIIGDAVNGYIAYNEVYNANRECFDAGTIYFGVSFVKNRGLVIEKNYVHDNLLDERLSGGAVVGIYLDDMNSGVTVRQNIIQNNTLAMLMGGGKDHIITDNLNVDNKSNMSYDNRGMNWLTGSDVMALENLQSIGWPNAQWKEAFPELTKLEEQAKTSEDVSGLPDNSTITGNVIVGQGGTGIASAVIEHAKAYEEHERLTEDMFDFADKDGYDLAYTKNSRIYTENNSDFPVIDFENIGLSEKMELGTAEPLAPYDGMKNVQGNSAVFRWKRANGADRYRIQIGLDKEFNAKVYDKVVVGTSLEIDTLKYDRTYYWRVQPVKGSSAEAGDGEFSHVLSFSTAKTEIVDKTKLAETLEEIGTEYLRATEGTTPGSFQPGAIEEFDKVVKEATDVLNNSYVKQSKVKGMIKKLEDAKMEMLSKQNIMITNIDEFIDDKDNWVGNYINQDGTVTMDLQLLGKKGNSTAYTGRKIGKYEILRMKISSSLRNYQGWGMNADSPDGELWHHAGYSIVAKRQAFELQKRFRNDDGSVGTGGQSGIIKEYVNEESIMTSDKWYTCEIGCVDTPFGPRIIMNIEGRNIIDYIDNSYPELSTEGYFTFYEGSDEYNSVAKVNG